MRRISLVIVSMVVSVTALSVTVACTPEAQDTVARTIGQLLGLWLWGNLPPHPGGV